MIERAYIHVAGPAGAGKTAFIEAILRGIDRAWLAARCRCDDSLRESRETSPKAHAELRRYRRAGATGAALFAFPRDADADEFFTTDLMSDYSEGVVIEGDNPLGFVDLTVFVAPPLAAGTSLFVRRRRDCATEERAKIDAIERALGAPGGVGVVLEELLGRPFADVARRHESLLEKTRGELLEMIARTRSAPPPKPREHWAIAEGYEGIEHAQLVVANSRDESERERGEQLVADIGRLRKERSLFDDVLGTRGTRTPVTALVANVGDPKDPGVRKMLARVRRAMRRVE